MSTLGALNANGTSLSNYLASIGLEKANDIENEKYINVASVGSIVSTTYEQLRNATEYAQEHLLMQKAIRRFFVRNLSFQTKTTIKKVIAEELISELTQSGYIRNNTQPVKIIEELSSVIHRHYDNFLRFKNNGVDNYKAQIWTLDMLSVESERIVTKDKLQNIYAQFAFEHYQAYLNKNAFSSDEIGDADFEASLYVSVYRSLLKSDIAIARYNMQRLYNISDVDINGYAKFNENIDSIFCSDLTNKITRYIDKYGAPLRILESFIKDHNGVSSLLLNRDRFNVAFLEQIEQEYSKSGAKLNSGLIKSIVFLLITKTIIGLAVEVPYDLWITGVVMMFPLIINLLSPVVYMALLRFGINLPNKANTKAMQTYMDNALYGDQDKFYLLRSKVNNKKYPIGFTIVYTLMFLVVFGAVIDLLIYIGFNIAQIVIFFIFFASASFLGFRLSRIVKELELVAGKPGLITTIRDFFFLPFTVLGKWLSEKYQKVNIIALILDTIIELPLKTVLRLIRQWGGFIDSKKDDI